MVGIVASVGSGGGVRGGGVSSGRGRSADWHGWKSPPGDTLVRARKRDRTSLAYVINITELNGPASPCPTRSPLLVVGGSEGAVQAGLGQCGRAWSTAGRWTASGGQGDHTATWTYMDPHKATDESGFLATTSKCIRRRSQTGRVIRLHCSLFRANCGACPGYCVLNRGSSAMPPEDILPAEPPRCWTTPSPCQWAARRVRQPDACFPTPTTHSPRGHVLSPSNFIFFIRFRPPLLLLS